MLTDRGATEDIRRPELEFIRDVEDFTSYYLYRMSGKVPND